MNFTISYTAPAELTELADGTPFPASISVSIIRIGVVPIIELTLEVREGRPLLTRFAYVTRGPMGPPLTASEIHDTKVGDIVKSAIEHIGATAGLQHQGVILPFEGDAEAGTAAADLARGRRGPSDRQIELTAAIARINKYNPRKEVASQLQVSERTATRFIAIAKERGLLEEEDTDNAE
jgi:hypothetical protein